MFHSGSSAPGKKQAETQAAEVCLRALGLLATPNKPAVERVTEAPVDPAPTLPENADQKAPKPSSKAE